MKTSYRGYEIHANRGKCLGGWTQLTYSIFRESDGREITSGFTDETVAVRTYVGYMKELIDAEAASSDPWGAIKAAVDAEREACAKVCEDYEEHIETLRDGEYQAELAGRQAGAARCAVAIRARGGE